METGEENKVSNWAIDYSTPPPELLAEDDEVNKQLFFTKKNVTGGRKKLPSQTNPI